MKCLNLLTIIFLGCSNPMVKNETSQIDTIVVPDTISQDKTKPIKAKIKTESVNELLIAEATSISNDFYRELLVQNYPAANKHLHPDALSVTSVNEWIEIYKKAQDRTGKLGYVKLFQQGLKCQMNGGNGLGDYVELIFDAQYKDGNLREKLTFFRKNNSEPLKILGYEYHLILDRITLTEDLEIIK